VVARQRPIAICDVIAIPAPIPSSISAQSARDWRDRRNGQFRKRLQASYLERNTYERSVAASILESTPSCTKITVSGAGKGPLLSRAFG